MSSQLLMASRLHVDFEEQLSVAEQRSIQTEDLIGQDHVSDYLFSHDAFPPDSPIASDDNIPPLEDIPMYESVLLPASLGMGDQTVREREWDIEYCVVFNQDGMPVGVYLPTQ